MKLILLIIAGVYITFVAALYLLQRSVLFHPDPTRPNPADFGVGEMQIVTLDTEDGFSLLAWWSPPANETYPVLVFFHGNAGHIGYRGEKLRPYLNHRWGVLLVSWRGYSGNLGQPSEPGLYADGRAALAFLAERGVLPKRQIVYGESLGAAVAVEMALQTRFGAVILEAPFTSVVHIAQASYPFIPVKALVRDKFSSIEKISKISSPLMIIHGEVDSVIPVSHGHRLYEAANEPKTKYIVPGAGHNNLQNFGLSAKVIKFINIHMRKIKPKFKY